MAHNQKGKSIKCNNLNTETQLNTLVDFCISLNITEAIHVELVIARSVVIALLTISFLWLFLCVWFRARVGQVQRRWRRMRGRTRHGRRQDLPIPDIAAEETL